MATALLFTFLLSLIAVSYTYIGYPIAVYVISSIFGKKHVSSTVNKQLPTVSLLIAAYNEEHEIDKRIQNALAINYPADRFEIIIASDGSTDNTARIVRRYAAQGVRLLDYKQRRGKASVLNSSFSEVKGEIVILSDANTVMDVDAIHNIVRWFDDPRVGVVCGRLILHDPETGRNVDSLYWKYETFLKRCESDIGALLGANGGIYAIRRDLYQPIPEDTIVDDFYIPLQARIRTCCAIIYDGNAVAREETPQDIASEFHRRARISAGGFQSIGKLYRLLDPRQGWIAFTFFSHKVLRWLCPFFLITLLLSNICLIEHAVFQYTLVMQTTFYLISLLTAMLPSSNRLFRPLRLSTMFTAMNLAILLGFFRWLTGIQKGTWKPTVRLAEVYQT